METGNITSQRIKPEIQQQLDRYRRNMIISNVALKVLMVANIAGIIMLSMFLVQKYNILTHIETVASVMVTSTLAIAILKGVSHAVDQDVRIPNSSVIVGITNAITEIPKTVGRILGCLLFTPLVLANRLRDWNRYHDPRILNHILQCLESETTTFQTPKANKDSVSTSLLEIFSTYKGIDTIKKLAQFNVFNKNKEQEVLNLFNELQECYDQLVAWHNYQIEKDKFKDLCSQWNTMRDQALAIRSQDVVIPPIKKGVVAEITRRFVATFA